MQEGLNWNEEVTLYHHSDGYPEYMVPLLQKAYEQAIAYQKNYWGKFDSKYAQNPPNLWELGRAGKAASHLCAADPGSFEPDTPYLHPDIEWFYVLHVINTAGGSMAENPRWEVTIYKPGEHWNWDNPRFEDLKMAVERKPLPPLAKKYAKRSEARKISR